MAIIPASCTPGQCGYREGRVGERKVELPVTRKLLDRIV